ncbi:MAG: nucleotidyltransferase family protein [Acidobacteriota bacterium]|nr:nucleotidyltransferase family protein [Acidobacteriota bacterium]
MKPERRANIDIPTEKIRDFCERHHVCRFALFGSVLRPDFSDRSDIDVLVEFDPSHVPGLDFFAMEDELTKIIGRKVDLQTPRFLSRYIRDQAIADAEVHYVAP